MQLTFTEEQTQLADSLAAFFRRHYDWSARRRIIEGEPGWSAEVWRSLVHELNIVGARLPASIGGLDCGAAELMAIMQEIGRALAVEPFLETVVIGGGLLKYLPGDMADRLLRGVVDGTIRLAFGWTEPGAGDDPARFATIARQVDDGWRLNGRKSVVAAAPWATHILIASRIADSKQGDGGLALFVVEAGQGGLRRHDYRTIDGRRASELYFEDIHLPAAALIGEPGQALPVAERVRDEAIFAVCAEALGVMQFMLEATGRYLGERKQFGEPLSSFQVLRHRVADMHLAIEAAVSAVWHAAAMIEQPDPVRGQAVSAAKVAVGKACRVVGQSAIQLHGAIGLTDELAIGHYFKRATMIERQFGTTDDHLSRFQRLSRRAAEA